MIPLTIAAHKPAWWSTGLMKNNTKKENKADKFTLDDFTNIRDYKEERKVAFKYFVKNIIGCVVGKRMWREKRGLKMVSEVVTESDEAFAILVIENCWDAVHENLKAGRDDKKASPGKYTSGVVTSNRRHDGWSMEGIKRYNELREYVADKRSYPMGATEWENWARDQIRKEEAEYYKTRTTNGEVRAIVIDDVYAWPCCISELTVCDLIMETGPGAETIEDR